MQTKITVAFDIKALEAGGVFTGYASVFGVEDGQRDIIKKGAFKDTLAQWQEQGAFPKLLWQHDPTQPIGVITALREDDYGLHMRGELLLDVARAQEAYTLLRAGAIDSLSIGYTVVEAHKDGKTRVIQKINLWEVSLVTFPANAAAKITSLKAAEIQSPRALEQFLREAGFSRNQARNLTNHGFKGLCDPREAGTDEEALLLASLTRLTAEMTELLH